MDEFYDFEKDLEKSNKPEVTKLFDAFYEKIKGYDSHHRYAKDMVAQRDYGTDVVLRFLDGRKITVDEKLGFNSNFVGSVACEAKHEGVGGYCKGKEWLGWWYTSHAEWVVYGWYNSRGGLEIDYFPFNGSVKTWFEDNKGRFTLRRTNKATERKGNQWFTHFYPVGIGDLKEAAVLKGYQTKLGGFWK